MSKIVFVAGLPRSGKSHKKKEFRDKGFTVFDDFKSGAVDDCSRFDHSKHLIELEKALKNNEPCMVIDIDFCDSTSRREAEAHVQDNNWVKKEDIEWIFFENDPHQCMKNIAESSEIKAEKKKGKIEKVNEFKGKYDIPQGVEICRVYK
jgi:hypothetical protein